MGERVVAVLCATGAQSGSVTRSLVADQTFNVRAVVRNPHELAVQRLKQDCPDVEIVQGNVNNLDSLKSALAGAYGCFALTLTPYEALPSDKWHNYEFRQGKNISDACKECGVQHLIMSTVDPDIQVNGLFVPQLTAKQEAFSYMRRAGLPVTGVMIPYYYENLYNVFKPKQLGPNEWGFELPLESDKQYFASVSDVGDFVRQLFLNRDAYLNKVLPLVGDCLTLQEITDTLNKHTAPVHFTNLEITLDAYRQMSIAHVKEKANLFEISRKTEELEKYSNVIEQTKALHPTVKSFSKWVSENVDSIKNVFIT